MDNVMERPMNAHEKYGYFDDSTREYVITNPRTPRKWINYIGDMSFGGFVDHTGGSVICKGDPGLNRITKYIAQMPSSDFKGETLYLRIYNQIGYFLFSPFYVPCLASYDSYTCRIGLGYLQITSMVKGIESEITILVPPGGNCELRRVIVRNKSKAPVLLDMIPVVEYSHFDALKQLTNADWVPQTMQSKAFKMKDGRVVLRQNAFMKSGSAENYFTASVPASSFETDRAVFLGDNEYGSWANPAGLEKMDLHNTEALNGDNIGALLLPLGGLQPGEEKMVTIQLGQVDSVEKSLPEIMDWFAPGKFEKAQRELKHFWDRYLGKIQVDTPDAELNSMLNIHNPRQCYTTKTWSRYLSIYQLGYGSRGMGYRDSSQDVMAVFASIPQEAKTLLRQLLSVQRSDGSAFHQFYPLTMEVNEGDSLEYEDRSHYYSDDHLWGVLAVCKYIQETGDRVFLDEVLPFATKEKNPEAVEQATVLDHLQRAVAFTRSDTGKHGLPHLGFADWNDTMNLPTGAESALSACLYGRALMEMIHLLHWLGMEEQAGVYQTWYDEIKTTFETEVWDGAWYRSYFDASGNAMGSAANKAGKIYAYGQAWPVLAGFASKERASQSLDEVKRQLNTSKGIKLSTPGFNGFDPQIGGMTTYPPGAKENGGIFLHVNPWVVIAETMLGRGNQAYQYYSQINPAAKNDQLDEYQVEPYVYAQNILGDEHPKFGMGRNSWLSGTASWMYQAGTQYILGVRSEYEGLRIDPCIPVEWPQFKVDREFRGKRYHIKVYNPRSKSKGVTKMTVDGQEVEGNLVRADLPSDEHSVEIWL
jgi:cellobiose phosphorylase